MNKKKLVQEFALGQFKPKEEELLEAFLDVAAREGVEQVTLQKVALEAQTAASTVHYYFGNSPTALINRALSFVFHRASLFMEEAINPHRSKVDSNSLHAYIDAKITWHKKYRSHASIWTYFFYRSTCSKEFQAISDAIWEQSLEGLRTLIILEIGKGHYPQRRNIDLIAKKIQQLLLGGFFLDMTVNVQVSGNTRDFLVDFIDRIICSHE